MDVRTRYMTGLFDFTPEELNRINPARNPLGAVKRCARGDCENYERFPGGVYCRECQDEVSAGERYYDEGEGDDD